MRANKNAVTILCLGDLGFVKAWEIFFRTFNKNKFLLNETFNSVSIAMQIWEGK